jgi:hypothetical protein
VRKTSLQDGDGLGGQACVAVDQPCWQARILAGPDGDVLDNARHTNLDEIIQREASLPGEQHYENVKNILSQLEGVNWAENASGNITSQALGTYLADSQFEGCAAQQALRFYARFCWAAIPS